MKSLLQSMTTRIFLILIAGVLVSVALATALSLRERQRMIGEFREFRDNHAAERVAQFILSLETVPPSLRAPFLAATAGVGMRAEPATPEDVALPQPSPLATILEERLPEDYRVASTPVRPPDCEPPPNTPRYRRQPDNRACEALLVTLQDGSRMRLSVLPPRPPRAAPRIDLSTYGIPFLFGIAIVAALVARMTMRPLKQLAQAAMELGNNIEQPPLKERGATEIRQAAAAFNAMQSRIRHHIQQRAHILAAITHDLQTPLTRMRLRLEKVEDADLREKLINDLTGMQSMVREGLDLARSMESSEPVRRLDLDSLVDSVAADATDAGQSLSVSGSTRSSLMARPIALRRCLTNLIDNAVKYGRNAHILASREGSFAVIRIRDDGPGIPDSELENVFDPFYRLETSRSRETGGTGLGLTTARNIAEQHGGTLRLQNRSDGGLEAILTLPCQQGHA